MKAMKALRGVHRILEQASITMLEPRTVRENTRMHSFEPSTQYTKPVPKTCEHRGYDTCQMVRL